MLTDDFVSFYSFKNTVITDRRYTDALKIIYIYYSRVIKIFGNKFIKKGVTLELWDHQMCY